MFPAQAVTTTTLTGVPPLHPILAYDTRRIPGAPAPPWLHHRPLAMVQPDPAAHRAGTKHRPDHHAQPCNASTLLQWFPPCALHWRHRFGEQFWVHRCAPRMCPPWGGSKRDLPLLLLLLLLPVKFSNGNVLGQRFGLGQRCPTLSRARLNPQFWSVDSARCHREDLHHHQVTPGRFAEPPTKVSLDRGLRWRSLEFSFGRFGFARFHRSIPFLQFQCMSPNSDYWIWSAEP